MQALVLCVLGYAILHMQSGCASLYREADIDPLEPPTLRTPVPPQLDSVARCIRQYWLIGHTVWYVHVMRVSVAGSCCNQHCDISTSRLL